MNNYETLLQRKKDIGKKLSAVILTMGQETSQLWVVGNNLNISGTTVRNYLDGKVSDGYLAEAIYQEFKDMKLVK